MDIQKIFQSLSIGLSRALRYSIPGVILICTFAIVEPAKAKSVYDTIGWQFAVFFTLVIGIGLYATHRSLVIPVHHIVGCFLLWVGEFFYFIFIHDEINRYEVNSNGTYKCIIPFARVFCALYHKCTKDNRSLSLSPTRWLGSQGIPIFRRMLAYRELRRYWFIKEGETEALDVQHAENGIPVMISEAIMAGGIYSWQAHGYDPTFQFVSASVLFLLSALSGMQQHRVECAHFKSYPERANEIIKKFKRQLEQSTEEL